MSVLSERRELMNFVITNSSFMLYQNTEAESEWHSPTGP